MVVRFDAHGSDTDAECSTASNTKAAGMLIEPSVNDNEHYRRPEIKDNLRTFNELRQQQIEDARASSEEAVSHLSWTREQVVAEQTKKLREMATHAKQNSPYYRGALAHIDPSTLDATDLSALPIITKEKVMENWDDIVTDPRLKLSDVNKHLSDLVAGRKHNAYYLDQYNIFATGGTSGKRGVFVWDWEMGIISAHVQTRWEALHDKETPPMQAKKTAVICAGSYVHASRHLFPTVMDPDRHVKVISAGTPIQEVVDELNRYQPDRIIGYASIVEELAFLAVKGSLNISPDRITTNSEPLEESAREAAKKAWGIDIHNSWGSVEIGLSAFESEPSAGLSLAEDYVIVEIVDENLQPVDNPTDASRALVTRLYGGTMPLIRYEMTDTIILEHLVSQPDDVAGVRKIKSIGGRADVWFDYKNGVRVHPMHFRSVLGQRDFILEYQVQQTRNGAHVLAISKGKVTEDNSRAITKALERALGRVGLENAEVTLQVVNALPRHPETNKLRRFVPLN